MDETSTSQGRIFGYARVSSTEQNLDRQIEALHCCRKTELQWKMYK